eukprot:scpid8787/ scgid23370/ WD repeat-containing protein 96
MDGTLTYDTSWVRGSTGSTVVAIGQNLYCYASGKYLFFRHAEPHTQTSNDSAGGTAEEEKWMQSFSGRHVDKLAVSHKRAVLAYSEIGVKPSVFFLSVKEASGAGTFPLPSTDAKPLSVLSGCAKLEVSSLQFSDTGSRLLVLSGVPDFELSIWDWEEGQCVCRTQCLERPVEASFCPTSWQKICCRGTGCLVFWTVETCGALCQLVKSTADLPRIEYSQYPNIESGGKCERLPPSYHRQLELILNRLGEFEPNSLRQPLVELTAMCWSRDCIVVSTACGSLLKVTIDGGKVKVDAAGSARNLFTAEQAPVHLATKPSVPPGGSILASCKDGILRYVETGSSFQLLPTQHELPSEAAAMSWTAGSKDLVVSCVGGEVMLCNSYESTLAGLIKTSSSPVVAMRTLWPGTDQFVTCRANGLLEVTDMHSGTTVALYDLSPRISPASVTTMALCAAVKYIVIGDSTGTLTYVNVDALCEGSECIFDVRRMHSGPVTSLWFDDYGYTMLSSSTDGKLFVYSAMPSSQFEVLFFVPLAENVVSICCSPLGTDKRPDQLEVFALLESQNTAVAGQEDSVSQSAVKCKIPCGSKVLKLCVPVSKQALDALLPHLDNTLCLDFEKYAGVEYVTLPEPCTDICMTREQGEEDSLLVATSAAQLHLLVLMTNPEEAPSPVEPKKSTETPVDELDEEQPKKAETPAAATQEKLAELPVLTTLKCPQLAGGYLQRSLRGDCVLSYGLDGQIAYGRVRAWDKHCSMLTHSPRTLGCRFACLSWDCRDIATAGGDGILSCKSLVPSSPEIRKLNADLVGYYRQAKQLMIDVQQDQFPVIEQFAVVQSGSSALVDVQSGMTWIERRIQAENRKTEEKFSGERNALQADIDKLRKKLLELIADNETKPDLERLDRGEFNLDVEESNRLMEEGNKTAQEVREELELKNIANEYFSELIRKECWENMEVPGKSLKAFLTSTEVSNFVLSKEEPKFDVEIAYLLQQREHELAELRDRREMEDAAMPNVAAPIEDDELLDDQAQKDAMKPEEGGIHASLEGSIAHSLGGRHDKTYSQLELCSRTRVYFQLYIIKHSLRKMKQAFNKEFDALLLQKESEVARTQERNVRMAKIIHDLELHEKLFEPKMSVNEQPERLLKIEDSEINAQKWISPEERERLEEQARLDEARRLAEMGDRPRERALDQMMKGQLEIDAEEELYKDIPAPEFMEAKMKELWTEDERKVAKDYTTAVANLEEERTKHKKALEAEFKKLQSSIAEVVSLFDDKLKKLHENKIERQTAICQEEMKVARLTAWLLTEDELCQEEIGMLTEVETLKGTKSEVMKIMSKVQVDLSKAGDELDQLILEDKALERNFKRDFGDREGVYDLLNKAFRRRPRQLRRAATQYSVPGGAGNPTAPPTVGSQPAAMTTSQIKQEMSELDSIDSCPDGVDAPTWSQLVAARRRKMESEKTVRQMNHRIAEMTTFINERAKEESTIVGSLTALAQKLAELRKERERFYLNLPIQLLMKQGQVEVNPGTFITDYRSSVLIDQTTINKYNADIKALGTAKVSTMLNGIEGKKGIYVLEWEHRKMRMQIEDADRKIQIVNGLRVTKELQKHFLADNVLVGQHDNIERMEGALGRTGELHKHHLGRLKKVLWNIKQKTASRQQENSEMDEEVNKRFSSVMDRVHLEATFDSDDKTRNRQQAQRMNDVVKRSRAVTMAKQQAEEIAALRADLDTWRMKMFPALPGRPARS